MGILYVVALPLGNLKDITLRALEILKSVDFIACEDTRNTKILLNKYDIHTQLFDCHKFNEKERSKKISDILDEDKSVALVSDAGTPAICDPGCILELELEKCGHKIVPVPGPSALITLLSVLPRDTEEFAFIGFIPRTALKKEDIFNKYLYTNVIFYESPNRLMETLEDIKKFYGENKKISIGRELTKIYEEIKTGTVSEIIDYYSKNTLKGEIVGMIYAESHDDVNDFQILQDINILKKQQFSNKDISKILSSLKQYPKNKVYELSLTEK